MISTSTIGTRETPFRLLSDMIDTLNNVPHPPVGFFVSQEVWDDLNKLIPLAAGRGEFVRGVQIMCDPSLSGKQFEIAFTSIAWRKRAKEIREADSCR